MQHFFYKRCLLRKHSYMRLVNLLSFLLICLSSCYRPVNDWPVCSDGVSLTGKWQATERFTSPGAGGSWNKLAESDRFLIEFKTDSTFSYSANFPKADSLFSVFRTNGPELNVSSSVNSKTDRWYWGIDQECRLSLSIFTCIESCPYRLVRVK